MYTAPSLLVQCGEEKLTSLDRQHAEKGTLCPSSKLWLEAANIRMKSMRTGSYPAGWEMPAAAVTVDAQDRVYCFNRTKDHPVMVFDRDGKYLSCWGAGVFAFPHTIRADKNDNLWWWIGTTGK